MRGDRGLVSGGREWQVAARERGREVYVRLREIEGGGYRGLLSKPAVLREGQRRGVGLMAV
jgi:hypothetical protein